jgi:RND family efflux transporter MFP subunit
MSDGNPLTPGAAGTIFCFVVALLSACGGQNAEPPAPRPVLTVELVSPARVSWPEVIVASGEVAPWQEASIGAEVTGIRLDKVLVNVGDVVTEGQLLAQFNEDSLRADLARLDASIAEAMANLEKAKADASRADRLELTGALPQQAIQSYRTQVQVAEAQLGSARAQRDAQMLRLRYARVVAPDDGVISSRSATVGAVSTMGAELFRLVRRNRLEWRANNSAGTSARLQPGIHAIVQTHDNSEVTGTLRQRSPTVDSGTRNGIAYVDLPGDSGLAGGMYVSGRFILAEREALAVPESAVVLRDGNQYLMKVDAQNRVHEIKIATGRRQRQAIELLSEIDPADRFVKSGGAFVSDGDLVQIASAGLSAP